MLENILTEINNYIEHLNTARCECDTSVGLQCEVCHEKHLLNQAIKEIQYHRNKWYDMEQNYIIPCFKWAEEVGIDLHQLVTDNPGHNCVELLVKELIKKIGA